MDDVMLNVMNQVFDKMDSLSDDEFFALLNKERDGSIERAIVESECFVGV